MQKLSLLIFLLAIGFQASAQQTKLSLQRNWSFDNFGADLGIGGLVAKDLNKNGRPEFIASGVPDNNFSNVSSFFSVIEFNPASYRYKTLWVSRIYFSIITEIQLHDIDNDGTDEIFLGFKNGQIRVLNGLTFDEIHSFFVRKMSSSPFSPADFFAIAFGDIDNDGTKNIVATSKDTTYVFDVDYRLKRKLPGRGGVITLANVDADPALESIYPNGQIVEYSGATAKYEYKFFPYNYGSYTSTVRTADMNKDGIQDVVYSSRDSLHIIDVDGKMRIRSFAKKEASGYVSDFQLYDYTKDGIPDLFVGNDQFEVLYVYNGFTRQLEFSLHDTKRNGLDALLIEELDTWPGPELLWTSGGNCTCDDHFFIYDMNTRNLKWMSKDQPGGSSAFDIGNINSDDDDELVIGSFGTYIDYRDYGFLTTLDAETKKIKLESTNELGNGHTNDFTVIKIGDIDNDGKNETLLGIEYSYSSTMVYVVDDQFNFVRTLEIDGMSFVADIEISDVDGDNANDVIVTSGTHVWGSTHPDEWQNYIYIFDGKTGAVQWRSKQIGGLNSRAGNVVIGNIDDDPAKEIVLIRYGVRAGLPAPGTLFVIDGSTHSLIEDSSVGYQSFDLADFDNDGIDDIIAGTMDGYIQVLDGRSFEVKKEITSAKGKINSLEAIDIDDDNTDEYIFSNDYKLYVFSALHSRVLAQTDTLGSMVGSFGSLLVNKKTKTGDIEIYTDTYHALFSFTIQPIQNVGPDAFSLLSPHNGSELPNSEWVEFSWETAVDDDEVLYTFTLSGNDLDTVVSDIPHTHILLPAAVFAPNQVYTWFVTATDQLDETQSESFTFKLEDEWVLGIEDREDQYKIFPNPFNATLVIQNTSPYDIDKVIITHVNGLEMASSEVEVPAQGAVTLDNISSLPPGLYICSLLSRGTTRHTVKLIKY